MNSTNQLAIFIYVFRHHTQRTMHTTHWMPCLTLLLRICKGIMAVLMDQLSHSVGWCEGQSEEGLFNYRRLSGRLFFLLICVFLIFIARQLQICNGLMDDWLVFHFCRPTKPYLGKWVGSLSWCCRILLLLANKIS